MNQAFKFVPAATLALGVLLVAGVRAQYTMPPVEPLSTLPTTYVGYSSRPVVVAEEEQKVAGMSDYSLREFMRDSNVVFSVYVGYYDKQVQGKTIHSPKNCLPGAGWEVMSSEVKPAPGVGIASQTVNKVILANKNARALVYYWYQGRGRIESNEYKVKWDLLRDAALHGRTEEALVRIVVPIVTGRTDTTDNTVERSSAEAKVLADSVAVALIPVVYRVLPKASWLNAQ